jgi:pimeloyl-ACP methyl ester carboxylesterase
MPKITANNIQLEYEITGRGEPLILIAGIGYSRWMWRGLVPCLTPYFQVITFDNRGVGGSERAPGPYTADMLAKDTAALLEALNIKQANVLGISMGGFIAQALALSRPDLIKRLILAATHFGGSRHIPIPQETLKIMMDVSGDATARVERGVQVSCAPGFKEKHPDLFADFVQHRTENPIEMEYFKAQGAIGMSLYLDANAFEKHLNKIQAPTLILFGDSDNVVPLGNAELLAKAIPGSSVKIIKDAGHFFPLESPEPTAKAITEFIQQN